MQPMHPRVHHIPIAMHSPNRQLPSLLFEPDFMLDLQYPLLPYPELNHLFLPWILLRSNE